MHNCSPKSEGMLRVPPQRYVITLLGFLLTVIASTMKYAVGIALTEMAAAPNTTDLFQNSSYPRLNNTILSTLQDHSPTQYQWSEQTQGLIFGALFWTYMSLQLPMGQLAQRVGPRLLLGAGALVSSASYLLTPLMVTRFDATGFVVVRVLNGAGLATLYPSLNVLLANWAPPSEKSKLGAIVYAGENVGFIVSMAASGVVLGGGVGGGGWPMLFYAYGSLGMLWLLCWALLGYDDPATHRFISDPERSYLQAAIIKKSADKKLTARTPWFEMARSAPLYATVIAQIGHDWGLITVVTELPKYMKTVLHYEIEDNGLLTAIPYVAMTAVAVLSGWLSDWILVKRLLSITTVRKLFTTISAVSCVQVAMATACYTPLLLRLGSGPTFTPDVARAIQFIITHALCFPTSYIIYKASAGPALGLLLATRAGCDRAAVVAAFTLAMALMGLYYPSLSVNTLDLSPNYSGTLMGFIALGGLAGILSPYLAGQLAPQGTMDEWHSVFLVAVCVLLATNLVYLVAGSGEVQPWNDPPTATAADDDPAKPPPPDRVQKDQDLYV